jgi:dGTPase
MNPREVQEQEEQERLSPLAMWSIRSRGREKPLEPCPLRTVFQRDRDRIIHCKSFRRLKFKTQVFLSPEGDHYRTRLTHTLEVAQVARTLARALRLNEDLTEAIALGHDLGHTPFGHIGERSLDALLEEGFRHNEQSLRMVEKLENEGQGLNLTWEVRNGILCHSGREEPATLEGVCVSRADRIAYINHDIDDAIRAGILTPSDLPEDCLQVLGKSHGQRIHTMILDIVENSMGRNQVLMSDPILKATNALRAFLFDKVYREGWREAEESRCDHVIRTLYGYYMEHPGEMPEEYKTICETEGTFRGVADFLASMTDRYAIRLYVKLFVPSGFPAS